MLRSAAKAQKDSQNVPVGQPSVGSLLRRLEPPRFLHAGSLAFLGLTLLDLISLKARGAVSPEKDINCIFLFLVGGPSQIDTWDLKPDAPKEGDYLVSLRDLQNQGRGRYPYRLTRRPSVDT